MLLAVIVGLLALLVLETRHLPVLRVLDARRYTNLFPDDADMPDR